MFKQQVENDWVVVVLQFKYIFFGKGVWFGELQCNFLIQWGIVNVVEWQVVGIVWFWQFVQYCLCDVVCFKVGDMQDVYIFVFWRGCLGDDSVVMVYGDFLCRCKKGGLLIVFFGINVIVDI